MAKGYNLGDLRAAIGETNRQIQHESRDGVAPNELVLSRLKLKRTSLISAFTPQLIDIALTKLLNEVAKKNHKNESLFFEQDLFANSYPNLHSLYTTKIGLKKAPGKLTFEEAQLIVERRKKRASQIESDDLERSLEELKPFKQSVDDTLDLLTSRKTKSADDSPEATLAKELQLH